MSNAQTQYPWTDNPTVSGVSPCDTDVLNDCLMHLKYENTNDTVQNMYPTGAVETETRGLEILKQMAHSTYCGDQAYNATPHDSKKLDRYGSVKVTDDGIASMFSNGRIEVPNLTSILPVGSTKFEIEISFKTPSSFSGYQVIYSQGRTSSAVSEGVALWCAGNGSSYFETGNGINNNNNLSVGTLNTNTEYKVKIVADGSNYKSYLSTEGGAYVLKNTVAITYPTNGTVLSIGSQQGGYYFIGSIDLKHFSITVDGVEVFSGNKTGIDTIKPDDYTVVGSPTITDDGIASGFATNQTNYINVPGVYNFSTTNSFEIDTAFTLSSSSSTRGFLYRVAIDGYAGTFGFAIGIENNKVLISGMASETFTIDYTLSLNTPYTLKVECNNGACNIYVNDVLIGSQFTYIKDIFTAYLTIGNGTGTNSAPFSFGSIDLNTFKIYVDGNLVYQPCLKIPYTFSDTGSLIVDSIYRDRVIDVYNEKGEALYYTLGESDYTLPMGELYGMITKRKTNAPDYSKMINLWSLDGSMTIDWDGWLLISMSTNDTTQVWGVTVNNVKVCATPSTGTSGYYHNTALVMVSSGDVVAAPSALSVQLYRIPFKQ